MGLAVAPLNAGLFPGTIAGIVLRFEFRAALRANIHSRIDEGLTIRAQILNAALIATLTPARFEIGRRGWGRWPAIGWALRGFLGRRRQGI